MDYSPASSLPRSPNGSVAGAVLAPPLTSEPPTVPAAAAPSRRAAAARTPARATRSAWNRLAPGAILLLSAGLNLYQLNRAGYGNQYYASAVLSMLQSWRTM